MALGFEEVIRGRNRNYWLPETDIHVVLSLPLRTCTAFKIFFFHWWALSDIVHFSRRAWSGSIVYASIDCN